MRFSLRVHLFRNPSRCGATQLEMVSVRIPASSLDPSRHLTCLEFTWLFPLHLTRIARNNTG